MFVKLLKSYFRKYISSILEILYIIANFFYILLYFQLIITALPNINQYVGKNISILRITTHFWLLKFQKLMPLFYGINFAPIFAIIVFKSFLTYLSKLKLNYA